MKLNISLLLTDVAARFHAGPRGRGRGGTILNEVNIKLHRSFGRQVGASLR